MTALLRHHLGRLAGVLADLKTRVRAAIAGELAGAVGGAVREVVEAVVAGRVAPPRPSRAAPYRPAPADRWAAAEDDPWGRPHDPWGDDPDDPGWASPEAAPECPAAAAVPPDMTVAVAAGAHVARWWLTRQGGRLAAAGLGLGVGLLGVLGTPVVRTAVAVLAAAADLLRVTDALGAGATRLDAF